MIGSRSPSHWPIHHPQRAVNATAPRIHGQRECLGDGRADAPNGAFVGSDCRRDMVAVGACGDGQRRLSASVNLCPSFQATRPGGKGFPRNQLFAGERAPRTPQKTATTPIPIRAAAGETEPAASDVDCGSARLGADRRCHHRSVIGDAETEGGIGRSPTLLRESPLARAEEIPEMENRTRSELRPQRLQHLLPGKTASIDDSVSVLEISDVLARVSTSSQPDDVEAHDASALAVDEHVRRDVLRDPRMAADHRQAADSTELMDRDCAGNERLILDLDMSPEHAAVGEDAAVADEGVVAEVTSCHDVIAASDNRVAAWLEPTMNRDVLAEDVVITDNDAPDIGRPGHVLRCAADDRMLAELVVAPGRDARLDHGARGDKAVVPQFDPGFHRSESADLDARTEPGLGTHGSQRMNAHGVPSRSKQLGT